MATYIEILEVLAPETGPVPAATIAAKLDTKVNLINTSLSRMLEKTPPWLIRDDDGNYSITEEGNKQLSPPTEESQKTTEYQQFILFGQRIGVTPEIVTLTAEHVWRGGEYTDLTWVWKAMTEQGIRPDLAKRWWHNWRSFLHQAIPPDLEAQLGATKAAAAAGAEAETRGAAGGQGKRDYILGPDDLPLQVGEGAGDMDYGDAVALSKLKLAAVARAAVYGGGREEAGDQVSLLEAVANAMKTFKEATKSDGEAKPLIITQGEDGVKIQEVEPGAPIVLGGGTGGNASRTTWVVEPDGTARELKPGEPVVIKQPAPPAGGGGHEPAKSYYIRADGTVEEVVPGKPIIIKQETSKTEGGTFINATTPDGKPIVIDLESYFKLEDHKDKRERDQESHELKMDTLKAIKELVAKGGRALDHMGED